AAKRTRTHHAGTRAAALTPAQINTRVNGLLARMTIAQKFGQLKMARPSTPDGSDLIPLAKSGQIKTVLDLTGVDNIDKVQAAALSSPLHIPLLFDLD